MVKFPLGNVVMTDRFAKRFAMPEVLELLARHQSGDWGDVTPQDAKQNELSLVNDWCILSKYTLGKTKVWIITEADRSATTVLLPEDY
jgi:hypothetical protein